MGNSFLYTLTLSSRQLCVVLLLVLSAGCDDGPLAEEYVSRAQSMRADGELLAAMVELKNAAIKYPDSSEIRFVLGQTYLELGYPVHAEKEFDVAIKLGDATTQVKHHKLKALLIQGQFEDVLGGLEQEAYDQDPVWLALAGWANVGLGEFDIAREKFSTVLELDGERLAEAHLGLAQISRREGDEESAQEHLAQALTVDSGHLESLKFKGATALDAGDYVEAEVAFKKALEGSPQDFLALVGVSRALLGQRKVEEAEPFIRTARQINPASHQYLHIKGLFAYRSGDLQLAKKELTAALAANREYPPSLFLMAQLAHEQNLPEQGYVYLKQLSTFEPRHLAGAKLLARAEMQRGAPTEAVRVLAPFYHAQPNDIELLELLGNAYMRVRHYELAIEMFQQARTIAPESVELKVRLAAAMIVTGDAEQAISLLEQTMAQHPHDFRPKELLVSTYLQVGESARAKKIAEELTVNQPDEAIGHLLLARVLEALGNVDKARIEYAKAQELDDTGVDALTSLAKLELAAGNLVEARAVYRRILDRHPGRSSAMIAVAELELQLEDADAARTQYEAVLELHPTHYSALLGLAGIAKGEGRMDDSERLLTSARDAFPDSPYPHVALTELYLDQRRMGLALDSATRALDLAPQDIPVSLNMTNVYLARGEPGPAAAILRNLVDQGHENVDLFYRLGETSRLAGELDQAADALEKALELTPTHLASRMSLAKVWHNKGEAQKALDIARAIQVDRPDRAEGYVLEGQLALEQGDPTTAKHRYQQAHSIMSSSATVIGQVHAMWQLGERDQAIALLESWTQLHPEDLNTQISLANTYHLVEDTANAIGKYEQILEYQPNHVESLNNLALLYSSQGDARARLLASRAFDLAPKSTSVADTFGWLLIQSNEVQQGVSVLEAARRRAPENAELRFHLALGYAKLGRLKESRTILKNLLESEQPFTQREEAEALLNSM